MRYAVKCDECKKEIRRTDDARESYQGGRCDEHAVTPWSPSVAFSVGFRDGKRFKKDISKREALDLHPILNYDNLDSYMNGYEDGLTGDKFRLNAIQAKAVAA